VLHANQAGASYQWINCDNGNSPVAGANAQSYTATVNGNYAVKISQNGCEQTSSCIAVTTVGMEKLSHDDMNVIVFPNPGNGIFHVTTSLIFDRATLKVMTLSGQLIFEAEDVTGENAEINLSNQAKGVYLLQISHHGTITNVKLIKD